LERQFTWRSADGFTSQARGKWMIPAYKVMLFSSLGASMYMMGRLVLVRQILAFAIC
jgi:hypothetical protein